MSSIGLSTRIVDDCDQPAKFFAIFRVFAQKLGRWLWRKSSRISKFLSHGVTFRFAALGVLPDGIPLTLLQFVLCHLWGRVVRNFEFWVRGRWGFFFKKWVGRAVEAAPSPFNKPLTQEFLVPVPFFSQTRTYSSNQITIHHNSRNAYNYNYQPIKTP